MSRLPALLIALFAAEPLAQLAGKTIYKALGETVNLGGADGLRLIGPRHVTLQLRK